MGLYKSELFKNIRYPDKKHEDEFTTYKLYLISDNIVYINEELYVYRKREGSIMRSSFDLTWLHRMEMYEERIEILQKYGIDIIVTKKFLLENQKEMIYFLNKYKYLKEKKKLRRGIK